MRDLMRALLGHESSKDVVIHAVDVELAAIHQTEEFKVIAMEEIETAITTVAIMNWFGDLLKVFGGGSWIIDSGIAQRQLFPPFALTHEADDGSMKNV